MFLWNFFTVFRHLRQTIWNYSVKDFCIQPVFGKINVISWQQMQIQIIILSSPLIVSFSGPRNRETNGGK